MRVRMRMVFSLVSSSLLLLLLLLGNHSLGGLHHTGGGGGVSAFRVNNLVVVLRRPTAAKASWTAAAAATTPTGGVKNGVVVHRGRRTTVALSDTADDDTNVGGNGYGGGGGRQSGATASNSTGTATSTPEPYLPDYGTTSVEVDRIKLPKVSKRWRRKDLFGSSLIGQTLEGMESDAEFQSTARRYEELGGQVGVTKQERERRRRALDRSGIPPFARAVRDRTGRPMPRRRVPTVLQINVGLYCNQACSHCHVESSPLRTAEQMSAETAARCLQLLKSTPTVTTLDITGGAPELNRHFRMLVRAARDIRGYDGFEIIDRCNLSVLQEPGQEDLVDFLREHRVRVVASLPCYSADNVDRQRGDGVFERSVAALLALNEAGYGATDGGRPGPLVLDLVYNPLGAFLPPEQGKLEQQYKRRLYEDFGISFNNLFTITNMPMKRFADFLYQRGELQEYMELLVRNFNPNAVDNLMCLNTVSVDWTGRLYDCDFNQQLGYNIVGGGSTSTSGGGGGITVFDLDDLGPDFVAKYSRIRTDNHCFGCTAGMGSS